MWRAAGLLRPWNDPRKDIRRKATVQPELFVVAVDGPDVVGSAMAGYDGHRGWVDYLAVAPNLRRSGLASRLMAHVEDRLWAMGCPKINIQIRGGNDAAIEFYRSIGFKEDDVISMGKRLEAD